MSYRWVPWEGGRLYDIGVNPDCTLHNPNGYPDETVRAAYANAKRLEHESRSKAAKKAAVTRRRRQEKRVYYVAKRIIDGEIFGPRQDCYVCGRGLDDPQSIQRGIGSDCWQFVLDLIGGLPLPRGETTTPIITAIYFRRAERP
jgi:hypothetical protein